MPKIWRWILEFMSVSTSWSTDLSQNYAIVYFTKSHMQDESGNSLKLMSSKLKVCAETQQQFRSSGNNCAYKF